MPRSARSSTSAGPRRTGRHRRSSRPATGAARHGWPGATLPAGIAGQAKPGFAHAVESPAEVADGADGFVAGQAEAQDEIPRRFRSNDRSLPCALRSVMADRGGDGAPSRSRCSSIFDRVARLTGSSGPAPAPARPDGLRPRRRHRRIPHARWRAGQAPSRRQEPVRGCGRFRSMSDRCHGRR